MMMGKDLSGGNGKVEQDPMHYCKDDSFAGAEDLEDVAAVHAGGVLMGMSMGMLMGVLTGINAVFIKREELGPSMFILILVVND